ncbi:hypothetical protein Tco_1247962, partial [Tanacetum coccineum]
FQVTPKVLHVHAVKRIFRYLKGQPKLGLWKSTTGGCQFLGKRLISWQCKKQTVVANSTTKAEYVAAANCYGQVLWIQNQTLDYGFNFINIKIYIDNESTICIVKNTVFYSKTNHIEIRNHFIKDSYKKKLIQVIKIHTDHNVADLLTKAFDVSSISNEFGVKTGGCKVNAARQDLVDLKFVDQHNVVACLDKSEGNADFHEIVDFLNASSVHYALTQIHATVDGKTVVISESSVRSDLHFNDKDGITCLTNDDVFENLALIAYESDSNKLTFQKALFSPSVEITLAKPFNDIYQTPAHTKKVFTNMKRKGKDFSGRVTLLFASMLAPPVVEGEGSGQPSEPQPAPSTGQPIIEEQIPVTESSSPQNTQSHRKALQEDTQLPQTSVHIPNIADEAVFKEWDDRVVKATTTAASLDVAQASGNISKTQSTTMSNDLLSQEISSGGNIPGSDEERIEQDDLMDFVPPTPYDLPLSGGHKPGSDEGRPNINELMAICTNLSNRVLALEQSKIAQDLVIRKLKKKVKKLEKKLRERTSRMKLFKIDTSRRKSLDKENVSKQGRKRRDIVNTTSIDVSAAGPSNVSTANPSTSTAGDIFEDKIMTIADTLVVIRSTRPRTTSVIIHDVEEEPKRSTLAPKAQPSSIDKGKKLW